MKEKTVFLAGLSGAGKTTFLHELATRVNFIHVSAGSLIAMGRDITPTERDNLRAHDLDENQIFLIAGFTEVAHKASENIIIDGHTLIETAAAPILIDWEVFRALNVGLLLHLTVDPKSIFQRRASDKFRNRPLATMKELALLQMRSIQAAEDIGEMLGVEVMEVSDCDHDRAADTVSTIWRRSLGRD